MEIGDILLIFSGGFLLLIMLAFIGFIIYRKGNAKAIVHFGDKNGVEQRTKIYNGRLNKDGLTVYDRLLNPSKIPDINESDMNSSGEIHFVDFNNEYIPCTPKINQGKLIYDPFFNPAFKKALAQEQERAVIQATEGDKDNMKVYKIGMIVMVVVMLFSVVYIHIATSGVAASNERLSQSIDKFAGAVSGLKDTTALENNNNPNSPFNDKKPPEPT